MNLSFYKLHELVKYRQLLNIHNVQRNLKAFLIDIKYRHHICYWKTKYLVFFLSVNFQFSHVINRFQASF